MISTWVCFISLLAVLGKLFCFQIVLSQNKGVVQKLFYSSNNFLVSVRRFQKSNLKIVNHV